MFLKAKHSYAFNIYTHILIIVFINLLLGLRDITLHCDVMLYRNIT